MNKLVVQYLKFLYYAWCAIVTWHVLDALVSIRLYGSVTIYEFNSVILFTEIFLACWVVGAAVFAAILELTTS